MKDMEQEFKGTQAEGLVAMVVKSRKSKTDIQREKNITRGMTKIQNFVRDHGISKQLDKDLLELLVTEIVLTGERNGREIAAIAIEK